MITTTEPPRQRRLESTLRLPRVVRALSELAHTIVPGDANPNTDVSSRPLRPPALTARLARRRTHRGHAFFDPDHRSVSIMVGDPIDKGDSTDPAPVKFDVKPGLICPVASYDFFRQREQIEQPIYARARGLANASFRWSINGADVNVRNSWTNVTINTPLTVRNPDGTTTTTVGPSVTIQYGILDA